MFRDGCADDSGHRWVHFWEAVSKLTGFTRAGDNFHFRTRDGWLTLLSECGLEVAAERAEHAIFRGGAPQMRRIQSYGDGSSQPRWGA